MKRDAFANFHPSVSFAFFAVLIGFAMFLNSPINLAISLICAVVYCIYLNGVKVLRVARYALPMVVFTAVLSPLFNRRGETILAYLPNGNPITLEALLLGVSAAVMLLSVIAWFSCFNAVMTSDKIVYLFGRAFPALSLIFSMSLRLVPRFRKQLKIVINAQKGMGNDVKSIRKGLEILSILISWSLENAIDTADSMKARGYGLPGRSAFSVFRFYRRDAFALLIIFACAATVLLGLYPAHLLLGLLPIILNLKEDLAWRHIERRIESKI